MADDHSVPISGPLKYSIMSNRGCIGQITIIYRAGGTGPADPAVAGPIISASLIFFTKICLQLTLLSTVAVLEC